MREHVVTQLSHVDQRIPAPPSTIKITADKSMTVPRAVLNSVKNQAIMQLKLFVDREEEVKLLAIVATWAPFRQSLGTPHPLELLDGGVKDLVVDFDFKGPRSERHAEFTALVVTFGILLDLTDLRLPVHQATQSDFSQTETFSNGGITDNLAFILLVERILVTLAMGGLKIDNAECAIFPFKDFVRRTVKRNPGIMDVAEFTPVPREVCASCTVAERAEFLRKTSVPFEEITKNGFLGLLGITENGCAKVIEWRVKLQVQNVFHALAGNTREAEASEVARRYCQIRFMWDLQSMLMAVDPSERLRIQRRMRRDGLRWPIPP